MINNTAERSLHIVREVTIPFHTVVYIHTFAPVIYTIYTSVATRSSIFPSLSRENADLVSNVDL